MEPPPVRRSDLAGAALVIAVAWITSRTSHPRFYGVSGGRPSARTQILHTAAAVTTAVARAVALSQTPLVLVGAVQATTLAVLTASRSSKEHPTDHARNVCWCVIMIAGVATAASACVTDQQLTPARVRGLTMRVAVLQQLLAWAFVALGVLVWIHESYYAFASERSWTRHVRRLQWEKWAPRDERLSDARARAFAVLSGLAAACCVFAEKCIAEIVRTGTVNSGGSTVPSLLAAAWIATRALEGFWWHHAVLVGPSRAVPLLHPYLCVCTMVGFIQGISFFDEIHPDHALSGAVGLTAILTGLVGVQFHAPIFAPARDAGPLLLGAAESLLDEPPAPPRGSDGLAEDASDPAPSGYRPPAHFRVL